MRESTSLIKNGKTLSIMLTYTCPAECKDCGTLSSPKNRENIDLGTAKKYIDDASNLGYDVVVFTGGEATLRWKDLITAINYATSLGLPTRLVTNAHWATSEKVAERKLNELLKAGLCEINFSTGDEHCRFIPIERVGLATKLSLGEKLGVSVMIETKKSRFVTKDRFLELPVLNDVAAEHLQRLSITESPWMPLNPNIVEAYDEHFPVNASNIGIRKPCDSSLTTYTVQATGKIGSCCGLGMRTIEELNVGQVGEDLGTIQSRAESDLLKLAIHYLGPFKLLQMAAQKNSAITWENMYAHHCQACSRLYNDHSVKTVLFELQDDIFELVKDAMVVDDVIAQCLN